MRTWVQIPSNCVRMEVDAFNLSAWGWDRWFGVFWTINLEEAWALGSVGIKHAVIEQHTRYLPLCVDAGSSASHRYTWTNTHTCTPDFQFSLLILFCGENKKVLYTHVHIQILKQKHSCTHIIILRTLNTMDNVHHPCTAEDRLITHQCKTTALVLQEQEFILEPFWMTMAHKQRCRLPQIPHSNAETVTWSFHSFREQRKAIFKHSCGYTKEAHTLRWWELFYRPEMLSDDTLRHLLS